MYMGNFMIMCGVGDIFIILGGGGFYWVLLMYPVHLTCIFHIPLFFFMANNLLLDCFVKFELFLSKFDNCQPIYICFLNINKWKILIFCKKKKSCHKKENKKILCYNLIYLSYNLKEKLNM